MFVPPRYSAVRAQRKITDVMQPQDPMSMNVRRPKRSTCSIRQALEVTLGTEPAGVEEERDAAREAEGGVDQDAVVGHDEDAEELVAPHEEAGYQGALAVGWGTEDFEAALG